MTKITEPQIGKAVLNILADRPGGTATIEQLKKALPDFVDLTDEDRKPSETRRGEEMWELQLRNLVSHRDAERNIIAEGYASHAPGSLTITAAGLQHVKTY